MIQLGGFEQRQVRQANHEPGGFFRCRLYARLNRSRHPFVVARVVGEANVEGGECLPHAVCFVAQHHDHLIGIRLQNGLDDMADERLVVERQEELVFRPHPGRFACC